MKQQIKPGVAIVIIAVVVLGAVWYIFFRGGGPSGTTTPAKYGEPAGSVAPGAGPGK